MFLRKKKSDDSPLTQEEKNREPLELDQIEKDFQRKIFIVKYKDTIFFLATLSFIIIISLFVLFASVRILKEIDTIARTENRVQITRNTPLAKPLVVSDPVVIENRNKTIDVVVKLSNENNEWGARLFRYTITFQTEEKNSPNKIFRGESYINPRENKYIIQSFDSMTYRGAPKFLLEKFTWERVSAYKGVGLIISNEKFETTSQGLTVSGTIENSSNHDYYQVDIVTLIFNGEGDMIGALHTTKEELLAKTIRDFRNVFSKEFLLPKDAKSMKLEVTTNFLDEGNFMKREDIQGGYEGYEEEKESE